VRSPSMTQQHGLVGAVKSAFPALGPRGGRAQKTNISSWNIRSGSSRERLEQIVLELGRNTVEFCAVQELRLPNQGQQQFNLLDHQLQQTYSYTLLFSGSQVGGFSGVGVFIQSSKLCYLKDWNASEIFPERIMWTEFEGLTIISFYGFTETRSSKSRDPDPQSHLEKKVHLYEELDRIYSSLSHRQPVILCGDFNARIGFSDNSSSTTGAFGDPHERRQNVCYMR